MADRPELLVVAGPNGAGKTTLATNFAAQSGVIYLRADAIAAEISPHDPSRVRFQSGRQFITSVNDHLSQRQPLIVETTLAGRTFRQIISTAAQNGFSTTIVYLFIKSVDVCVARVAQRVRMGGHDVPEADLRRRFSRSLVNFWTLYREMADKWVIVYNETAQLQDVAVGSQLETTIRDSTLFRDFLRIGGFTHDD